MCIRDRVQAVIIPIADRHVDFAKKVAAELNEADLRVDVDERSDRMNAKIRDAEKRKIPYMLVVGDREIDVYKRQGVGFDLATS